jgi:hypothetical protein
LSGSKKWKKTFFKISAFLLCHLQLFAQVLLSQQKLVLTL